MPSHVTKREAQAVTDYAADLIALLALPRYRVLVMTDPADDDAIAEIDTVEGKWVARLWLASDWMKRTSDERRETITHEVLHLIHQRVDAVVIEDARQLMHDHEADDLARRYTRETELMVDHLAVFLAETHALQAAWDKAHK